MPPRRRASAGMLQAGEHQWLVPASVRRRGPRPPPPLRPFHLGEGRHGLPGDLRLVEAVEGGGEDLARGFRRRGPGRGGRGPFGGFRGLRFSSSVSRGRAPSRLPSFLPSGPTTTGRWAYSGRGQAERPGESDLPRRRGEEIRAAHDLRDALFGVVHDDGELVGVGAVGAPHDEIADLARRHSGFADRRRHRRRRSNRRGPGSAGSAARARPAAPRGTCRGKRGLPRLGRPRPARRRCG